MHVEPGVVQDLQYKGAKAEKFTAANRLLRDTGFNRVLHADNISSRFLRIYFARNNMNNARLGIIVPKKILPRSVDRSRVKRLIREIFRKHSIKTINMDLVVMIRSASALQIINEVISLAQLFSQVEFRCAK